MDRIEHKYFQHDYDAMADPKMLELLVQHGPAGIGIFWCLVENLYEQCGTLPMSVCKGMAFKLHVEPSIVESVVNDFGLFNSNGEYFWSESINRRMAKQEEIRNKRIEAGKNRWKKKGEETNVVQENNSCNTSEEQMVSKCRASAEQVLNTCSADVEQMVSNKNKIKENKTKENKDSILLSTANAVDSLHSVECDTAVNYPGIVKYWNDNVSNFHSAMGTIQDINEGTKRRDNVRARIKQYGKQVFADTLIKALQSDFLNGRTGRGKVFNFDWVILPSNFVKVRDGNYDNDKTVIPVSNGNTNNQEHSTRESRESDAAAIVDRLLREDE